MKKGIFYVEDRFRKKWILLDGENCLILDILAGKPTDSE